MEKVRDLGQIQRVNLREVWPHEASDFSPWLAEHIEDLGASLGMELELQSLEKPVGAFSLDLFAREVGTNRNVIVENQLESTNHDHLGKLLTYAAGCDSNVIVWIAREFRDEHRQALDWLNQHTDEDTEFFGVLIEVWTIDNSRPAPNFMPVIAPNQWQREAVRNVRGRNISPRRLQYQSFFQDLIDDLRDRNFTTASKGQPQNWYSFATGFGQRLQFGANFGQGNIARVELYIDAHDKEWNKEFFDRLLEQTEFIESKLQSKLEWERLDERRACRVAVVRPGSIDDEERELKEIRDWMVERLLDFKQKLSPILKVVLQEQDSSNL